MNILQINSGRSWGGGEVHLYHLSKGLVERGHEVTIIGRKGGEALKRLKKLPTEVKGLPLRGAGDVESIFRIARIIKEKEIDIIHLHMGREYWLGILASKLVGRVKIVITRHILSPLGRTFLHRRLYANVDGFIAVSQAVKKILVNENKISKDKIEVIYNGIRREKFKSENKAGLKEELGIKGQGLLIGTVGRLTVKKNQELLIKAAAELKEKYSELKYVIVGKDSSSQKEYKKWLEVLIEEFELEEDVFLLGFREDIVAVLNSLDLLVVPSLEESFGIVAVEGMATATPVIASEVGGLKEVIKNGETGLLFPIDDVDGLVKEIIELVESRDKRDKIVRQAQKEVEKRFSIEKMIGQTENLYQTLV